MGAFSLAPVDAVAVAELPDTLAGHAEVGADVLEHAVAASDRCPQRLLRDAHFVSTMRLSLMAASMGLRSVFQMMRVLMLRCFVPM